MEARVVTSRWSVSEIDNISRMIEEGEKEQVVLQLAGYEKIAANLVR